MASEAGAPRVVVASDSFKGSLTSAEVADIVRGELLALVPGARCDCVRVADGGEGTLDAIVASTGRTRDQALRDMLGAQPRLIAPAEVAAATLACIDDASRNGEAVVIDGTDDLDSSHPGSPNERHP